MNIEFIRTLLAIRATGSFAEAAEIVHLSHSTVSVQMKRLEERLGKPLFHKGRRPAQLTSFGLSFCDMAEPVIGDFERLMRASAVDSEDGLVRIGFVSTTLQTLLPAVLRTLGQRHPRLRVNVISGLSDELAQRVEMEKLDFAFVSAPTDKTPNLQQVECAREPLMIVAQKGTSFPADPLALFAEKPFIGFNPDTWLGSQIRATLSARGVVVNQLIQLDSIDAIEHLVGLGLGISVVPQRIFAQSLAPRLAARPFLDGTSYRTLSLVAHNSNDRQTVMQTLADTARRGAA